tara:strand:- start:1062 stop:1418 length:357 start_codon:yes stop_codon:yes gene_type:complete
MSLVFLAVAIVLGAIGSHFLESKLTGGLLEKWEIAVHYQFWNALGLMGLSLLERSYHVSLQLDMKFIIAGILLFSGSIYILCLAPNPWIVYLTPLGGISQLIGYMGAAIRLVRISDDC